MIAEFGGNSRILEARGELAVFCAVSCARADFVTAPSTALKDEVVTPPRKLRRSISFLLVLVIFRGK
jgi:hypothetical protein